MILSIQGKSSDLNYIEVKDGIAVITEKNGYFPYINGVCGGDYFDIQIDTETGKIIGWNEKSKLDLEGFINRT